MTGRLPLAHNLRGGRFQALALALVLVLAALIMPPVPVTRTGVAVLAVTDITGSMNTHAYARDGHPESHLALAKAALRRLVADLPCGSRMALALFTERHPFLLFTPVEVCADAAPLDGALSVLDWRMAWAGTAASPPASTAPPRWRPSSASICCSSRIARRRRSPPGARPPST